MKFGYFITGAIVGAAIGNKTSRDSIIKLAKSVYGRVKDMVVNPNKDDTKDEEK